VVVENGVVKFYFASGKSDLAKGANEALAEVVKGVKAGQKAVISGFHDSTGNLASNQELAKKRAISVRDTLIALGVPADSIELKKPENAKGTGDNAEARRVEVVLAK
jgi:outer membrane protein OmpA-like peptidoglycan-associated protein